MDKCPTLISLPGLTYYYHIFISAIGASDNPCSETFAGFAPFSEPESLALANFVMENVADNGIIFFTTHSYSQLWMTPFGYTDELPPNYDAMVQIYLL